MSPTKKRPAVAYVRVSTKKQGERGTGLEAQWEAITKYANLMGYQILEHFSDALSGAGPKNREKRPGFQQAIKMAKEQNIPIIVSSLDRVARHAKTIEDIVLEEGITLISATEGRMENHVIVASKAAQAQYTRDLISQHTKRALAEKKRQGVKLGNPNLPEAQRKGAERNKERANRKVQEIAEALRKRSNWGSMTATEIVEYLNTSSILTGRGNPWTLGSLRRPFAEAKRLLGSSEKDKKTGENLSDAYANNPLFGRF